MQILCGSCAFYYNIFLFSVDHVAVVKIDVDFDVGMQHLKKILNLCFQTVRGHCSGDRPYATCGRNPCCHMLTNDMILWCWLWPHTEHKCQR